MAKIAAPLMSLEARGTIAQFLTFSKRNSGQQVRWQKKQQDVETDERVVQREKFLQSSLACRFFECGVASAGASVCGLDILDLNSEAFGKPMSGYNLGIQKVINYF